MKTTAISGPFYAPNKVRKVEVLRNADLPGFKLCKDLETGEVVVVHEAKLGPVNEPEPGDLPTPCAPKVT